jgi:hypothetical protein
MSHTLIDFTCAYLEGDAIGHMYNRTNYFCCYLSHKMHKETFEESCESLEDLCINNIAQYSCDINGNITCDKPCKYCIMDFVLKRFANNITKHYRRVKYYKDKMKNIKCLRNRELTGRIS